MMFTIEDVQRIYEAKCKKYPPEEIMFDLELKNQLYKEAINEVRIMNMINKGNSVI